MEAKTFRAITSISMVFTITAVVIGLIAVVTTGLYPGIAVLLLIALIPITSKVYANKRVSKSNNVQGHYFTPLALFNLLAILVVVWMSFVILIERVFSVIL
ncbi:MAG TPA: hypothetical protein VGK46_05605 [Saprospiraceae bacterium]